MSRRIKKQLKKKSWLEWSGIVVLALVLVLVTSMAAFAHNYTWTGTAGEDNLWNNSNNWTSATGTTYPQGDEQDSANINDVTLDSTCVFNLSSTDLNELLLAGDSPTWMTLHVSTSTLAVRDLFTWGHYGALDIDEFFQASDGGNDVPTHLLGAGKVDIEANEDMAIDYLYVKGANTSLNLTTAGDFFLRFLVINADTDNAARALTLDGGSINIGEFDVTCGIVVTSDPAGNGQATLWVKSTEIVTENLFTATFTGGTDPGEEAELDLDVDLNIHTGSMSCFGRVDLDVAANRTLAVQKLTIVDCTAGAGLVRMFAGSGATIVVGD